VTYDPPTSRHKTRKPEKKKREEAEGRESEDRTRIRHPYRRQLGRVRTHSVGCSGTQRWGCSLVQGFQICCRLRLFSSLSFPSAPPLAYLFVSCIAILSCFRSLAFLTVELLSRFDPLYYYHRHTGGRRCIYICTPAALRLFDPYPRTTHHPLVNTVL